MKKLQKTPDWGKSALRSSLPEQEEGGEIAGLGDVERRGSKLGRPTGNVSSVNWWGWQIFWDPRSLLTSRSGVCEAEGRSSNSVSNLSAGFFNSLSGQTG